MEFAAVVVAAGRGARAGDGEPKQYRRIGGRPVLARSLDAMAADPATGVIQPVIAPADRSRYAAMGTLPDRVAPAVDGGDDRQASVLAGLEALSERQPTHVLIHDAARPFASPDLIRRVRSGLAVHDAVVPVTRVNDTLRERLKTGLAGPIVPRENLLAMQTPQGFVFDRILAAHRAVALSPDRHTDDAAVAAAAGIDVATVDGDPANLKLTTAADLDDADLRLAARTALALPDVRTGTGYDVHPFGPGEAVILGGVRVPHDAGLVGHSDADVILHALTDAILGALADGDIGTHFPPSDPQWRGASSDVFLRDAVNRVHLRGGIVAHLDATLIGETPRIAPYRERIAARIAGIAGVAATRVGLKATTNEGLGFIGRGEGVAAMAVATIRLPGDPAA